MIELLQAPAPDRIIADGNDTFIKVKSTYGQERYFRVFIKVNGQNLYDQIWSKDENLEVNFNLRHLYYSYFTTEFTPLANSGYFPLNLKKKITIEIKEFITATDQEVDALVLPEFYIIKSHKPQFFEDSPLQILDFEVGDYKVAKGLGLRIPLFVKSTNQLSIFLINPAGQTVYSANYQNIETGVGYVDIAANEIPQNHTSLKVKLLSGQFTKLLDVQYVFNRYFPSKSLYYLNNFGIFCYVHLFGKQSIQHKLKAENYQDENNRKVNYEIEDDKEIEINSGYVFAPQTNLNHAIATSLDIRLYLEGNWEKVISETKKLLVQEDGVFNYEDTISFSKTNRETHDSSNAYLIPPVCEDLEITGYINESLEITLQEFLSIFESDYSATSIRFLNLPVSGILQKNIQENVTISVFFNANNPESINLNFLNFIKYTPNFDQGGEPLEVIPFQIFNGYMWSAPANLILNLVPNPNLEGLPPLITFTNLNPVFNVNEMGWSKLKLFVSVTFFGGGGGTYEWGLPLLTVSGEIVFADDNGDISFLPDDVEDPFIKITDPEIGGTRVVGIKATDNVNGLSSRQSFAIPVNLNAISINGKLVGEEDSGLKKYEITISGGLDGETVNVYHDYYGADQGQFAIIEGYGNSRPDFLSESLRKQTKTLQFNKEGKIIYEVSLTDYNRVGMDELRIKLVSASELLSISSENQYIISHEPTA